MDKRRFTRYVRVPKDLKDRLEAKMEEARREPNKLTARQQRKLTVFGNYILAAAILGWEQLKDMSAKDIIETLEKYP